jgi:lysozyme
VTTKPKLSGKQKAGGAAAGATALALMFSLTSVWEGRSLDPYRDIVGKWTVCDGETRVEMRRYTEAECNAMSERAFQEHLDFVQQTIPGVEAWPFQHSAYADTAYNIGKAGFARSSMASNFRAGNFREGCRSILKYKFAGGKVVRGLELRRTGDAARIGAYEMCLGDAVAAELERKGTL